jgi:hypothetical protein
MDDFQDFQDFQEVQGLLQHLDEDGPIEEPPVRETRILWERNNSETEYNNYI